MVPLTSIPPWRIPLPDLSDGLDLAVLFSRYVESQPAMRRRIVNLLKTGSCVYARGPLRRSRWREATSRTKRVRPCAAYLNCRICVKDMYVPGVPL